jgi:hypothetical protein
VRDGQVREAEQADAQAAAVAGGGVSAMQQLYQLARGRIACLLAIMTMLVAASLPALATENAKPVDAQVQAVMLAQLVDAKARHAAAKGNDLLQASIAKQYDDMLCFLAKNVSHAIAWNGTLVRVEGRDAIRIILELADGIAVQTFVERSDPVVDVVATLLPGTRVTFDGRFNPYSIEPALCTGNTSGHILIPIQLDSVEVAP